MCLTISGDTLPLNKLCGNRGSCVEDICVCDSGWTRSLDSIPHIYAGSGAEEIFNSLKKKQIGFQLVNEFSLSAPCVKYIGLWNFLHILGIIVCLVAFVIIIRTKIHEFRKEKFEILKVSTVFFTIIVNSLKLVEKDPIFPFKLNVSYTTSLHYMLI
eukprot:snap_masked-scaffold_2-processed-gene-8.30-mRNA-1 protein AED:1.00 eAED:1.00 QI:0/0/0/0/1/1/2/0/156